MFWRIAQLQIQAESTVSRPAARFAGGELLLAPRLAGNLHILKFFVPGRCVSYERGKWKTWFARMCGAELLYGWKNERRADI